VRAGYERVRINVPLWHYNGGYWSQKFFRSSYLAMRNNVRFLLKNESLREITRQAWWLIRFVCRPHQPFDPDIPHLRRLRPSSYAVNVAILSCAFLWNIVFLPITLWKRWQDGQKIKVARQRLDARCATIL